MGALLSFLFRYSPRRVMVAMVLSLLAGLCNTGLLVLLNRTLNAEGATLDALPAFLLLCAMFPITRVSATVTIAWLSERAVFDLRLRLARLILSSPLRNLESLGPQKLLAVLSHDVSTIAGAITQIPILGMHGTIYFSGLGYLFYLYWPGGLGVIAATVIGLGIYQMGARIAHKHMRRARQEQDQLFEHFRALTHGNKELKFHSTRRERFLDHLLGFSAGAYLKENVMGRAYLSGSASIGQAFYFLSIALAVFGLPYLDASLSDETRLGFTLVLLYLLLPLDALSSSLPNLLTAAVSYRKANELGGLLEQDQSERDQQSSASEALQELELAGVCYSYQAQENEDGSGFQVGPVDLTFKPGELNFIAGGNGSGKTTLAKLLTGLYPPSAGEIVLNGKPINDQLRDSYRQNFACVFDDFYLFDSLLGLEDKADDQKAHDYLNELRLTHKVTLKDARFSTTNLSKGQRKRLALLVAYLEDRPLYLFDEWAADQDPEFKQFFYEVLLPQMKAEGKCVIAITHDDAYFGVADRLLKLQDGKLAQVS